MGHGVRGGGTRLPVIAETSSERPQINMRLDNDVIQRLKGLAIKTGRTKTFYVTEATHEFLYDREDYFLAKVSLQAFVDSGEESLGIEDLDWGTP